MLNFKQFNQQSAKSVLLVFIILFTLVSALSLRIFGIDWDNGGLFHPDERAIITHVTDCLGWYKTGICADQLAPATLQNLFNTEYSPLNPGWFNYGTLPLYLLKLVEILTDAGYHELRISGRLISAMADTITIFVVYLISRRLFSARVGLIAMAFGTFAVLHIQISHFLAVDSLLTMFVVCCVYFSVLHVQRSSVRSGHFAAVMFGLALATKFAALPLGIVLLVSHAIIWFNAEKHKKETIKFAVFSLCASIIAFVLAQPYAILDYSTFISDISYQSMMVRRTIDLPFTRQYIDTLPYLYQIVQVSSWGVGPVLGILLWVGFVLAVIRTLKLRRKGELVVVAWVVPYFLITGGFEVKFIRYMHLLTPFMFIYAAAITVWITNTLYNAISKRYYSLRVFAFVPIALVLLSTVHYALSFVSIYTQQHPAHQAAEWINSNAENAILVKEHWEEAVPIRHKGNMYTHMELQLYNPDTEEKFSQIAQQLQNSDYLVMYSNRLYGTILRLPERYPTSSSYYRTLFSGELGYELVFSSTNLMSFGGIAFYRDPFARVDLAPPKGFFKPQGKILNVDMGWADESFYVYDNPHVMVFKNIKNLSADDIVNAIYTEGENSVTTPTGLLLEDHELALQRNGQSWQSILFLTDSNLPVWLVWLVWIVAIQLIGLITVPTAYALFRVVPESSVLWAKILGLITAATATWLMVSLGFGEFSLISIWLGIAFLLVTSTIAFLRFKEEIQLLLHRSWRSLLAFEIIFLLAFSIFLVIRAANPDLWHTYRGGEKPMDFAYLNAITRSVTMPPYDPWFSGGHINYYYFGQFIVAWIIRLVGIETAIGYNLAVASIFAFAVSASFAIGYTLSKLLVANAVSKKPWISGMMCSLLACVIGNVDGFLQLVPIITQRVIGFDYWRSSRVISTDPTGYEITEFPFFTFLFGDLHAHMLAIPFAMLALGLAISGGVLTYRRHNVSAWIVASATGISIGALRAINTWDFPVQAAIASTIFITAILITNRSSTNKLLTSLGFVSVILGSGYVVFYPFDSRFEQFSTVPIITTYQTPIWHYFVIHLPFVFIALSWIGTRSSLTLRLLSLSSLALVTAFILFNSRWATLVFLICIITLLLYTGLQAIHSRKKSIPTIFVLIILLCAFSLGGAVEIFTLKGDIGRMNTVFKFYIQAWWLMAIACGTLIFMLFDKTRDSSRLLLNKGVRITWYSVFIAIVIATLVYPVMALKPRLDDRITTSFISLDGSAYMEHAESLDLPSWCFEDRRHRQIDISQDKAAISWLRDNAVGFPIIVEGIMPEYCWGNRFSVYTGFPAVIGWQWHQTQQRINYAEEVENRRRAVDTFYSSDSIIRALQFLEEFNVQYIIVGSIERQLYPQHGIDKFQAMEQENKISTVFTTGATIIYRVN